MRNRCCQFIVLISIVLMVITTAAQDSASCSSSLTFLQANRWAKTTPGDANNVRLQPNRQAEILGQIPGETHFRVLNGPTCADNLIWWQVESEGSALRGWMAEGSSGTPFIEALDQSSASAYRELMRTGRGTINAIAWRPDGKALLVAGSLGISYYTDDLNPIGYWDKVNDDVFSLAWHPDGRHFVTGGGVYSHDWQDGTLRLWDAFTGKPTQTLLGNTLYADNPVSSKEVTLGWNADGTRLLSIDIGQTSRNSFRLWNAATQELLLEVPSRYTHDQDFIYGVNAAAGNSSFQKILFMGCGGDAQGDLQVWSTSTGKMESTLYSGDGISCLYADWNPLMAGWSSDNTRIATVGQNYKTNQYMIQIWDAVTYQLLFTIPVDVPLTDKDAPSYAGPDPMWIVWSADGKSLTSVNADASVRVWDAQDGSLLNSITLAGQTDVLQTVSWSPAQDKLATSDSYNTLRVWDTHTGALLSSQYAHLGRSINFAQWSPDTTHIATVTQVRSVYSEGSRIHVWNTITGEVELSIDSDNRLDVFWSADGTKLFSGTATDSDQNPLPYLVWDAHTGERLKSFDNITDLWGFLGQSDDRQSIGGRIRYQEINEAGGAIIGDKELKIVVGEDSYNTPTWTVLNPNGSRIAIVPGQYSAEVRIYDTSNFSLLATYHHHHVGFENSEIRWLEWSPDGFGLVSAGLDGTLHIWGIPEH